MDIAHELKIWPMWYREVVDGQKRFEIRRADRDFQAGQVVRLREYIPETAEGCGGYTGGEATILITHVVKKFVGLADGYCAFGFVILRDE
jgi:hypothetical protein